MVTEQLCKWSDLPKEWCGHCKGLKTPEEEEAECEKLNNRGMIELVERLGRD